MKRPPPHRGLSEVVNVVDEDPDLAQDLSTERLEKARLVAVARLAVVKPGDELPPAHIPVESGALGLLMLEGVVVRSFGVGDRRGLELFGGGDVLRPCERTGDVPLIVPAEVTWWALTPTRLALLDARFTRRMCAHPEVIAQLIGRLERRSSAHALRRTIIQQPRLPERLHLLLWHLADRFGRVHADGVVLALPLSHELLAQLAGAQRPSISRALKQLERAEVVARRPDGSWWLGGAPPLGA
jgi:CRP-like cAMP-binding protein